MSLGPKVCGSFGRRGKTPAIARAAAVCAIIALAGSCKSDRGSGKTSAEKEADESPAVVALADTAKPDTRPELIVLSGVRIAVNDPKGRPAVELYPHQLAQQIGHQLAESGFFAADESAVPSGHRGRHARLDVTIDYDVVERRRPRKSMSALVAIESQIVWEDDSEDFAPGENIAAERTLRRAERKNAEGVMAEHAAESLTQVGRGLIIKERVRSGGIAGLRRGLADADVDVVLWSLDLAGERKAVELFDVLVGKLASPDVMIRDRSITALVALGDRRAVDPLTKSVRFDDLDLLRTIIEAVVALGGTDAREYLEFLASGHEEEDIRERAREGLGRLDRRKP